jgi:hypothetical protein
MCWTFRLGWGILFADTYPIARAHRRPARDSAAQSQVANHARLGHQRQGAHALHELVFDGPDPPQVHKDFWKAAYAALAP